MTKLIIVCDTVFWMVIWKEFLNQHSIAQVTIFRLLFCHFLVKMVKDILSVCLIQNQLDVHLFYLAMLEKKAVIMF